MKATKLFNYHEFKTMLIERLKSHYGNSETVIVSRTFKPNVGELTGVSLAKPEMKPSATLYIEYLYKAYCESGDFDEVIERIITVFAADPSEFMPTADFDMSDTKELLERMFCCIIGADANEEMLKSMPHKRHEDLAIVYRTLVSRDEKGIGSLRITDDIFEHMGIGLDELHERALANTEKMFPQMMICNGKELMPEAAGIGKLPFIWLTNEAKAWGATTALYPGLLNELAEKIGCDLFLLPSSLHEFIILPDDGRFSEKALADMVKETNDETVAEEDRLTDSIYRYRRGDETFRLCRGQAQENAA